jgi:outer membrane autotransporter protein
LNSLPKSNASPNSRFQPQILHSVPLFPYRDDGNILRESSERGGLGVTMFQFVSITNAAALRNCDLTCMLPTSGWRTSTVLGGLALSLVVFGSSGALALNCTGTATGFLGPPPGVFVGNVTSSAIAIGANLSAALNTANTAFLTQSTAFVGAPPNPQPDQAGGGVWTRGVGGEVDVKSGSTSSVTLSAPLVGISASGNADCTSEVRENFAGIQVGQDIARLNLDGGWNLHLGTTAGEIGTNGSETGGVGSLGGAPFTNSVKVPFFGTYAAVTNGGFTADAIVRGDFFQADLNSPALNIDNQSVNARGITIGGSVGYHYNVPQSNWFVEPSAGLIYSRVHVDPFNSGGVPGAPGFNIQGTMQLNDIVSTTGRLGVRFGENIASGNVIWQPFAAVSIWSDFGATISGNYSSCGNPSGFQSCAFLVGIPVQGIGSFTAQGVGTYGQYSVGIAGQIVNTGWLGFARVDFRDGERLEGWDGTAGIRYQFTPDLPVAAKMPIYKAIPVVVPYSWGGLYVGGVLGADAGWSRENFSDIFDPLSFFPGGGVGDAGPRVAGLLGGAEVGYNYQIGKWVLGVEADLTDTNTKGSVACTDLSTPGFGIAGFPPAHPLWNTTCNAQASWIGTVTGRLGLAWWDRSLFYIKGGAAFTHETFSATCNIPGTINGVVPPQACFDPAGNLLSSLSSATNAVGGTVGIGTEFALTRNWSAKAEWDYINFGSRNLVASDGTVMNAGMSLNEVKIGANYHFVP